MRILQWDRPKARRICVGLVYSASFTAMLVQFYLYSAETSSAGSGAIQQICHHLFFLSVNLALPVLNVYRWFFRLSPIRILGSTSPKRP